MLRFFLASIFVSVAIAAFAEPAPPIGLTAIAGDHRVVLHWTPPLNDASTTINRSERPTGPFKTIAENVTADHYSDDTVTNARGYFYNLAAVKDGASSANSVAVQVTPNAIPLIPPWKSADLGKLGIPGSASMAPASRTITIRGSGVDAGASTDAGRFAHLRLDGDGSIVAHVVFYNEANEAAKFGVMIRETLEPNSPMTLLAFSPKKGTSFTSRRQAGSEGQAVVGESKPWLKLIRQGSTCSGFISDDGEHWSPSGTAEFEMARNSFIGLFVCSHDDAKLSETIFDHVQLGK